jgi:phenylalanine-4-hydroxylase
MSKHIGLNENNIPEIEDVSNYLKEKTGWRVRPCGGMLKDREFLNALAFKVFNCS